MKDIHKPNDLLTDTVFIMPILNKEQDQVLNVFQRNEHGWHALVAKIYHEEDKETGKMIYIARSINGKAIFKSSGLLSLKEKIRQEDKLKRIFEERQKELQQLRGKNENEKSKTINR